MRSFFQFCLLALLLVGASFSPTARAQDYYAPPQGGYSGQQDYAPSPYGNEEVEDYSMFYDALAPHGDWFFVEEYGYVWMPRVNHATWRPYVDGGSWVWSDYGWMWVSTYEWGWAPFHYGRWVRLDGLYWVWVPDAVWGPAWVAWRYTDADVGWAPLPPGAYWYPDYGLDIMVPIDWGYWVFVSGAYIFSPTINVYVYPTYRTQRIYYASRPSTVYRASSGVPVCVGVDIRRVGVWVGAPVTQVSITLSSSYVVYRGGYTNITLYRPPVRMVSARYVPVPPAPRMAAPASLYRMSAPPAPRGSVASSQHYKSRATVYKSSSNQGNGQGSKAPYGGNQYGGKDYDRSESGGNRPAPQPYKSTGSGAAPRQYEQPDQSGRSAPPPAVQEQQLLRESRQQTVEAQRNYQRSTRDGSSQETVEQRRQEAEQTRSNHANTRSEVQRERSERRTSTTEHKAPAPR